jgi:dTDP-4-amino-4,6-dideoxygalactose transaminase
VALSVERYIASRGLAEGPIHDEQLEVPFVDLRQTNAPLKPALVKEFDQLISDGRFLHGPEIREFEAAFADYCGVRFCVGVSSGLDALRLGLLAAGISAGDEVVVPALTFAATFEAVVQAGGTPVPVDVGEADYNLAVDAVEAALTPKTRFIVPVHLYGQLADMQALLRVAARPGLEVIEDACQAHGAARDGIRPGKAGGAAAFSFYPTKNLGAMGDAGALATDQDDLAQRVRSLREHGQRTKYEHAHQGYTARLDTIQAIVLLHKLPGLDQWNRQRSEAARFYSEALDGLGDLVVPSAAPESHPVWHLYVVRTSDPAALARFLERRGIMTGRHYPQPPHLAPAYKALGYPRGSFPVAERLAREVLSLPLFPGISEWQLYAVVDAIRDYFSLG